MEVRNLHGDVYEIERLAPEDFDELKKWLSRFRGQETLELRIGGRSYNLWTSYERDRFMDGIYLGFGVSPASPEEVERRPARLGKRREPSGVRRLLGLPSFAVLL